MAADVRSKTKRSVFFMRIFQKAGGGMTGAGSGSKPGTEQPESRGGGSADSDLMDGGEICRTEKGKG